MGDVMVGKQAVELFDAIIESFRVAGLTNFEFGWVERHQSNALTICHRHQYNGNRNMVIMYYHQEQRQLNFAATVNIYKERIMLNPYHLEKRKAVASVDCITYHFADPDCLTALVEFCLDIKQQNLVSKRPKPAPILFYSLVFFIAVIMGLLLCR